MLLKQRENMVVEHGEQRTTCTGVGKGVKIGVLPLIKAVLQIYQEKVFSGKLNQKGQMFQGSSTLVKLGKLLVNNLC